MKRANSRRHRAAEKSHRFLVVFLVILLLTIAFFCDYYKGTVRQTPLPDLFIKIHKIPIKHMFHAFDGYFAFSPFKCTKRASALV